MLGKFDSPQASLKTCLKQMNKEFLKYLNLLWTNFLTKTVPINLNNGISIFSYWLYNNYGNILKNVINDYVIIDNVEEFKNFELTITGGVKFKINNIINAYVSNNNKTLYEELLLDSSDEVLNFLKNFGMSYDDLIASISTQFETKNLLKNFFNNIMSNDYSYLNSILNTMNPKDKQHISILMNNLIDTLETELTGIETVLSQTDISVFNTFASNVSKKFDAVITKWCNDNFSANYHWLSNLELQKINEILSDNANFVDYSIYYFDDILDENFNRKTTSLRDFFTYFFQLIDENENIIDLTKQIPNNIKLRLNMKRLTFTNGGTEGVDNRFYGFIYTLAKSTLVQQEIIEQKGGSHLHFSLLDRLRNEIMISNNKILFNRIANYSNKIYAIYDLFFDFFIGYDPNNFIHTFLKSHYSSRPLTNCSDNWVKTTNERNLRPYTPEKGGNAINHGALLQGLVEQLGGNNLAYDMYLSDTTLQLHNNELEHSIMSDIMRGGVSLDQSKFNNVNGRVYFSNNVESINEIFCKFKNFIDPLNLSQNSINMIENLFKTYMETHVEIMRTLEIAKSLANKTTTATDNIDVYMASIKNNPPTKDFQQILNKIKDLKDIQNAQVVQLTSMTNSIAGLLAPPLAPP
jgi:hypothetical protein